MILYHGSNVEIEAINLEKCRPYKDFGKGFYLTTIKEQAQKMAVRTARLYGGSPVVTIFEFDDCDVANLSVRRFNEPDKDWALFVINNRNKFFADESDSLCNHDAKYDLVIGPVANDDLALLFRQFATKRITVDILVQEMKYKSLTDQYSFHSEKSFTLLKKIGVEK